MSNSIQRSYYEDDILNATPQRLRLMLIEGAIRFARHAMSLWDSDRSAALQALGRCRNIVIELVASIRADRESCEYLVDHIVRDKPLPKREPEAEIENLVRISRSTMSVLLIVFRQLDEAQLSDDSGKISEAIEILEVERETAALVCEQLPAAPELTARREGDITSSDAAKTLKADQAAPPIAAATYGSNAGQATASLSFEA